jgi:pimeloyl-ACP methyl ester carboxylesterase
MNETNQDIPVLGALAVSSALACALLCACADYGSGASGASASPLNCDDGIKAAFKPDANTSVVAVRAIKAGDKLVAVDSAAPITAATDMCLVKLLVGPGVPSEPRTAPSFSEGIGIEIWLPARANWNERIRNYGGGGWVGGGHRYADQIGSKVPALVNANMGYAVGTTDAGQPLYQDGSFILKADGSLNREAFRDFSYRAMVEQATKAKALVRLYYGKAQKFAYFDGHSQGGRQGLKVAQRYPELYDGYMIAAPAIDQEKFGLARLYVQIVLRTDLGFTAVDADLAKAFAAKVGAVNARAVAACDKEHLGFLLDPFACDYDPAKDAAALCVGATGDGVVGSNADTAACVTAKEAVVIDKIWYGATNDGSYESNPPGDVRTGKRLGAKQLWWPYTRGADVGGLITSPGTDSLALVNQDASYASSLRASYTSAGGKFVNASTSVRDKWTQLSYAGLADAMAKSEALQPELGDLFTSDPDLSKLRARGAKVLVHHGLGEDVIPAAGMINYYSRVAARMGGDAEVQKFMRLYLTPAVAHSSQGRAYTIGNAKNGTVPQPRLPGNGNQTPTRERDQMFSALIDWVEKGIAPADIVITSSDGTVSYPICVYPQKITWNGTRPAQAASSYSCR